MMQNQLDQKIKDSLAELEVDEIKEVPEKPELPETLPEKVLEIKKELPKEKEAVEKELEKPSVTAPPSILPPQVKSPIEERVVGILEEGLADVYNKMPADKQQEFKKAGEETASKITKLLKATKVKVKEIFNLILRWLKIIPGVDKFFLEQEAKIKSDRILALKERMKKH